MATNKRLVVLGVRHLGRDEVGNITHISPFVFVSKITNNKRVNAANIHINITNVPSPSYHRSQNINIIWFNSSIKTEQILLLNLYHTYRQQNINICSKTYQSELMPTKTSTPTTKDETKVCYYSVFDMLLSIIR